MGSVGDAYDNALCESFFAPSSVSFSISSASGHRPDLAPSSESRLGVRDMDFGEGGKVRAGNGSQRSKSSAN